MKTANRSALVFSTAVLLACVCVVPSTFADEAVRAETVKFQDLNVDSPAGAQSLYTRIHAAAKRVCAEADPVLRAGVIACTKNAEEQAIQKLSLPQLTAYYRGKTGNQPLIARR
jgi:UrcA family protein